MQTLTYTAARSHLAGTMEEVCENHTAIIITRANAKPVVIMSLEDFDAMVETNYLMKSPRNAARLTAAIEEIEAMVAKKKHK
jgi:antitoxin YefM